MYKLIVSVPIDTAERVKKALFDAGIGRIGLYEERCFEIRWMDNSSLPAMLIPT